MNLKRENFLFSAPPLTSFGSAFSIPAMTVDSIGYFSPGSTAPTSTTDKCSACRSKKKHGMCKKGCKCRVSPTLQTSDAPVFAAQTDANSNSFATKLSTSSFSISATAYPTSLFPPVSSSSSAVISSAATSTTDEIKQNKATRNANKEPVTNSPLPLTLVSRSLNGIPQNPHFYQLRNYSELTRKKLISAWDQIFEETVKEIQSLQAVDFWVRAKKLWKTMEELQNLGYSVIALRKRLVELTDVMLEFKLSKCVIKGLKIKAENHRMEKSRLESLIVNLQAMAKREEDSMESKLIEAEKLENDVPKFDAAFAKLAKEPL